MQFKLLSWNIWQGNHLSEIIDFLKKQNPDIIGLQEVIEKDNTNTAQQIAEKLGYQYVYYPAISQTRLGYPQGNAILTKLPIIETKRHFLSDMTLYKNTAETEPRIAVESKLKIGDTHLNVFSVHLAYSHKFQPSDTRNLQISNLINLLPDSHTVLMGDFNSHPDSPYIQKLTQKLNNTDKNPIQPTWTIYPFNYEGFQETQLKHRLDYIFTSKDIKVKTSAIENSTGSDHLPISAIIEI